LLVERQYLYWMLSALKKRRSQLRACLVINIPSDSEMIFRPVRRMEAQILYVSKPTTTKPGGKSAGMLGIDIVRQALKLIWHGGFVFALSRG
jgi:hypothetical protein